MRRLLVTVVSPMLNRRAPAPGAGERERQRLYGGSVPLPAALVRARFCKYGNVLIQVACRHCTGVALR